MVEAMAAGGEAVDVPSLDACLAGHRWLSQPLVSHQLGENPAALASSGRSLQSLGEVVGKFRRREVALGHVACSSRGC